MGLLAQTDPRLNFWNGLNGSNDLWLKIIGAFVVGLVVVALLTKAPANMRRPIIATMTFLAGLFYILQWLWPEPIAKAPGDAPGGFLEGGGFFISDSVNVIGDFYNILAGILLGLGVFSVLRIHTKKVAKQQQDWPFSLVLLVSMLLMVIVGYVDWWTRQGPDGSKLDNPANWAFINHFGDLLFDGLLQTMDAAMFSLIAFYILSAAYRAFRIRSVEATILLGTALIVILSLLGVFAYYWGMQIDAMSPKVVVNGQTIPDTGAWIQNLRLENISAWISATLQTPSLRAIDFGVGIGALAMGMRLWLSLERGGVSQ